MPRLAHPKPGTRYCLSCRRRLPVERFRFSLETLLYERLCLRCRDKPRRERVPRFTEEQERRLRARAEALLAAEQDEVD